jgi:AraC-like DNA-binding protein
MIDRPISRLASADLDRLMQTLEVTVPNLGEARLPAGTGVDFAACDMPILIFQRAGQASLIFQGGVVMPLGAGTLVLLPPGRGAYLHASASDAGHPEAAAIWGHVQARYGSTIDLFAPMLLPAVESFAGDGWIETVLGHALHERTSGLPGGDAIGATLVKTVVMALLRRAVSSNEPWVESFSLLGDRRVAHAFADMSARPGAAHSVLTLCQFAGLSRTAFMTRFSSSFGMSPMAVLRQLRMRYAAVLLRAGNLSIDQIVTAVGYSSRSAFFRAFVRTYGSDPSDYRSDERHAPSDYPAIAAMISTSTRRVGHTSCGTTRSIDAGCTSPR